MSDKNRPTRGRMSRIQQLPKEIKDVLDRLLENNVPQAEILRQAEPLLADAGLAPLSRSGLNRYATKREVVGQRIREAREVADAWTAKFGEAPDGEISQRMIEMLRSLAFDMTMRIKDFSVEDVATNAAAINDLAMTVQRIERTAEMTDKRKLRAEMAQEAETAAKKAGISDDTAAAIRAALDEVDEQGRRP